MQRTIKFRAKSYLGDWHYGMLSADLKHIVTTKTDSTGRQVDLHQVIDPSTIGQFTGCTDINGKEIYEGDVLMFHNSVRPDILQELHRVSYCPEYGFCQWECVDKEDRHGNLQRIKRDEPSTLYGISQGAILGNIHDNPELLKGGEK